MRITVDPDKCCGSGQCVFTAPDVFDQAEDTGMAVVSDANPPVDRHADIRAAADGCPTQAIELAL